MQPYGKRPTNPPGFRPHHKVDRCMICMTIAKSDLNPFESSTKRFVEFDRQAKKRARRYGKAQIEQELLEYYESGLD